MPSPNPDRVPGREISEALPRPFDLVAAVLDDMGRLLDSITSHADQDHRSTSLPATTAFEILRPHASAPGRTTNASKADPATSESEQKRKRGDSKMKDTECRVGSQ